MSDQMWKWLDDFPQQIQHAAQLGEAWDLSGVEPPRAVSFLGIGGSAIGATLVSDLYGANFSCPVVVSRGDQPPSWLKEGSLAVAISYSGETRETLTAFRRALEKGARGISVSSGGSLARLADERKLPHLLIPEGMAPRAALGYTSLPLIYMLQKLGVVPAVELELDSLIRFLQYLRVEWGDGAGTGAGVARRLLKRLPLIVGAGLTAGIAHRFQAQLAENAKAVSVLFEVPEALHNLVETLDMQSIEPFRPIAIYLDDPDAPEDMRFLLSQVREAFQEAGIEGIPIQAEGKTPLIRLYALIHKTDWISYHLAKLKGGDPVAIPIITSIKKRLPSG